MGIRIALAVAVIVPSLQLVLPAEAQNTCGIVKPLKPLTPVSCTDTTPACVCDASGLNCHWTWACVPLQVGAPTTPSGIDSTIPLSVKPPQIENPLDTLIKLQQLRSMQQQNQAQQAPVVLPPAPPIAPTSTPPGGPVVVTPAAPGLSWADETMERNCRPEYVPFLCSTVWINSVAPLSIGTGKFYSLGVLLLSAGRKADFVDFKVVLETADHVKQAFFRKDVAVELDEATGSKHFQAIFGTLEPVLSVLSIDTTERYTDGSGESVETFHQFRPPSPEEMQSQRELLRRLTTGTSPARATDKLPDGTARANGRVWVSLSSPQAKAAFLLGYRDASKGASSANDPRMPLEELVAAVDRFYLEPSNLAIPMSGVLSYIVEKAGGARPGVLQGFLDELRREASGQQDIGGGWKIAK